MVINCAAFTDVDGAESKRAEAMRINGAGVGVLAEACEMIGAALIQISTDYVFDGEASEPYPTGHPVSPVNYYGESKAEGEYLALSLCSRTCVVRTSWLHSEHGKNFANTMRRLFQEKEELRVVNDQIGRPTHARNLAQYCVSLALDPERRYGIHHFAGEDVMTWYDFACRLHKDFKGDLKTQRILPIPSSEFPTPASRPKYSVIELEIDNQSIK